MNNYPIDWQLLNNALYYFQNNGYKYIEVPWIVHESVVRLTLPKDHEPLEIKNRGSLIGSAEQGFLSLVIENKLPLGKYVSCSPCFRNEPILDKYHQIQFMKVELYDDENVNKDTIWDMIENVESFLIEYVHNIRRQDIVKKFVSFNEIDIELNGIEIGSYGVRSINGHNWIYGTGLALPRFSVVNEINIKE